VGTVDACQGSERSVVILSACASSGGHMESPQRLCVALTRAKSHLCIVGGATALWSGGELWRGVISAAAEHASGLRSTDMRPLLAPGDDAAGANNNCTHPSATAGGLACLCSDVVGAHVPAPACRAILRFLYNSFHSVTLLVPVDAAFARLPLGVYDYLMDPSNVDLARYVVLTHLLHGQTYLYDCSLADALRAWHRLDQRTATNAIVTLSRLSDAAAPQAGARGRRWGTPRRTSGVRAAFFCMSGPTFLCMSKALRECVGVPFVFLLYIHI
jgi:hypothetical protein